MYLQILKKDLKRKKTMNLILLIFIILAATFIASSANNMVTVTTALDSYFEKAEVPDGYADCCSNACCQYLPYSYFADNSSFYN